MTARTRKIRHTAKPRAGKYIALGGFAIAIALVAAFVIAGVNLMQSWLDDLPDYKDTDSYLLNEPSQMLDADGNVIAEFYDQNRITIGIDECSPYILQATVDVEDERFYSHKGVDLKGILRAVVAQLTGGSEGASTITQQLVRNTVLKDEQFEKTLSRKVREAHIALELEKMYSKDEILMLYLNSVYYGQNCYGVEAAAQTYFGKTCADLTLAEAATLAGLPQSPSAYDPTVNPNYALERRNVVLGHMLNNGHITQEQYDEAVASPLVLNLTYRDAPGAFAYPSFVNYVISELLQQFSMDTIKSAGLTIKTTLSPAIQSVAQAAVDDVIGSSGDDGLESALIAIEPVTGQIKAMVSGTSWYGGEWNLATQAKRQPGSSFKTFTLVAAIKAGMNPTVLIDGNSPIAVGDWNVNNYGYVSYGNISLEIATWNSVNTAYAQIIHELGPEAVIEVARAMGVTSELDPYDALTLGTSECTVLEMAGAYATLANGGVYNQPTAITEVLDRNGNVIYRGTSQSTQALTPEVSYAVTSLLQGVVSNGTGTAASLWVDQPVAGKTGTTDDYADLWFCGYTPQLSCAVWVGHPEGRQPIYYQGSIGTTGALPSPIFSRFMSGVLQGMPRQEFTYAASPSYVSNTSWSFSLGTWTEPVEEDEPDDPSTTDDPTYSDVTSPDGGGATTEPESGSDSGSEGGDITVTPPAE